jgi:diacylglycerol kinase (ATP)
MMLIVNPEAGGGTALHKLKSIEGEIQSRYGAFSVELTLSADEVSALVADRFARGERRFVAAGGDGCVNTLLRAIMTSIPAHQRRSVMLGAVGLGSSNDFHKPLSPGRTMRGIPWKMDFSSARPRDVVKLEYTGNGSTERRYFMVNASAGVTAEANRFFNDPDPFLALLKRRSTRTAIHYAAFRTMTTYRSRRLTIISGEEEQRDVIVTNLAILKSPHVSGGLKFPGEPSYDSGLLQFHLAGELPFGGRLRLFQALAAGHVPKGRAMQFWQSREATLSSDRPFALEFDGEVINTNKVRFSVLPRHLRVCTC